MIPSIHGQRIEQLAQQPDRTYQVNWDRKELIGLADGVDAVKQAIYFILQTERYAHLIYSWNYGFEWTDLIGKPMPYVLPELQQRITEALLQDERILEVNAFSFEISKRVVQLFFTVETIFGQLQAEKVVEV